MSWMDVASIIFGKNATSGDSEQVDKTDDSDNALHVAVKQDGPSESVTPVSVNSASSGNTVLHTPASGKAVRLWWYQMTALPTNAAAVIASLRFGAAGALFASTPLSQYGSGIAHSFKAGKSYVQGAVDEPLYGNLSAAQTVYFNVDIEEI